MDLRASHEQASDEGIQQGKAEGMRQAKYAIAKGLLAKQLDRPLIAQITGLSEEALKELE